MVLSNAVQNSMNGGDNSVTSGLILAVTLVVANWSVGKLTTSSRLLERFIEGDPVLLLHDGRILQQKLESSQITRQELMSAIHKAGYADPGEIRAAILENDGTISVIPKQH
jgi:uncharacterized membrane protein YcaP (DUF421 family)